MAGQAQKHTEVTEEGDEGGDRPNAKHLPIVDTSCASHL
jgi:hypothetical protein